MNFQIESIHFHKDPVGWPDFTRSPGGVVGRDLQRRGEKLKLLAQRSVPKHHGALAASIKVNFRLSGLTYPEVRIGSQLKYALMVHEGTRPHEIRPHAGHRFLRFTQGGKVVYAHVVHHPGTKPTYFLSRHLGSVVK